MAKNERKIFGWGGDPDERMDAQAKREMRKEAANMRRFAQQLEGAGDDAWSPAWIEAAGLLSRAADDLEREADLEGMSDRRPLAAKAGGAHAAYNGR